MSVQRQGISCKVSACTMAIVASYQLLGVDGATEIDPSDYTVACTHTRAPLHKDQQRSGNFVSLALRNERFLF